jgi:hypothetical protein
MGSDKWILTMADLSVATALIMTKAHTLEQMARSALSNSTHTSKYGILQDLNRKATTWRSSIWYFYPLGDDGMMQEKTHESSNFLEFRRNYLGLRHRHGKFIPGPGSSWTERIFCIVIHAGLRRIFCFP